MESQSSSTRGDGDQDCPTRAAIASVRREADWDGSARVPRPDPILDDRRSGGKTNRVPTYYYGHRTHDGLEGRLPEPGTDGSNSPIDFDSYRWRRHCRGLYQTPIAA